MTSKVWKIIFGVCIENRELAQSSKEISVFHSFLILKTQIIVHFPVLHYSDPFKNVNTSYLFSIIVYLFILYFCVFQGATLSKLAFFFS